MFVRFESDSECDAIRPKSSISHWILVSNTNSRWCVYVRHNWVRVRTRPICTNDRPTGIVELSINYSIVPKRNQCLKTWSSTTRQRFRSFEERFVKTCWQFSAPTLVLLAAKCRLQGYDIKADFICWYEVLVWLCPHQVNFWLYSKWIFNLSIRKFGSYQSSSGDCSRTSLWKSTDFAENITVISYV